MWTGWARVSVYRQGSKCDGVRSESRASDAFGAREMANATRVEEGGAGRTLRQMYRDGRRKMKS